MQRSAKEELSGLALGCGFWTWAFSGLASDVSDLTKAMPLAGALADGFLLRDGFEFEVLCFGMVRGARRTVGLAMDLRRASHEADHIRLLGGGGLVLGDGLVVDLSLDELLDRDFVSVDELGGVEGSSLALDQLLGEVKGVGVHFGLLDVGEVFLGVAQFLGVAHGVGHHAAEGVVLGRRDGDDVLAAGRRRSWR